MSYYTSLFTLLVASLVAAAPTHEISMRATDKNKKKKPLIKMTKKGAIIMGSVVGAIFLLIAIGKIYEAHKAWKKRRDERRRFVFGGSVSAEPPSEQPEKPKGNWMGWKRSAGRANVKAHEPVPMPTPDLVSGMEDPKVAEVAEQPWSKVAADSENYPASKVMVTMPSPTYGGWDRQQEVGSK